MSDSLYVGDLGLDVTEADLEQVFGAVSRVRSVSVCRDVKTKVSLGYAYVNMAEPGAGKIATQKLNYSPLKGKMMRIMPVVRDPKTRKLGIGNLYVTGLPQDFTNRDLYSHFSALGAVNSCKVATDDFGVSLGYGYVAYESDDLAKLALQRYNNTSLNGSTIAVKPFVKSKKSVSSNFNNVYVKNLGDMVTEGQLVEAFSLYGPVLTVCLKIDEHDRKFAFVTYQSMDDAQECVNQMNGKPIEGLTDFQDLYVARAMKRKERDSELKKMFDEEVGVPADQPQYWTGASVTPSPYMMPPGMPMVGMPPPPHPGMHPHHMPHHHHQHHPGGFGGKSHQNKLYFRIPDPKFDDNSIRAAFAEHGDVTQVNIRREASNAATGIVFFATPSMAHKALTAMRGKPMKGSSMSITLKYSTKDNFGPGPSPQQVFGVHPQFGGPVGGYQGDVWGKPAPFNRVAPPTVHGKGARNSHMGPNGFSGLAHKNNSQQSKIARQLADLSSKSDSVCFILI